MKRTGDNASRRRFSFFQIVLLFTCLLLLFRPAHVSALENRPAIPVDLARADVEVRKDNTVLVTETFYYTYEGEDFSIAYDIEPVLGGDMSLVAVKKARVAGDLLEELVNVTPKIETRPQPLTYTTEKTRHGTRVVVHFSSITGTFAVQLTYQWNPGIFDLDGHAAVLQSLCSALEGTEIRRLAWTFNLPSSVTADRTEMIAVTPHPTSVLKKGNVISVTDDEPFVSRRGIGFALRLPLRSFTLAAPPQDFNRTGDDVMNEARALRQTLIYLELLHKNSTKITLILSLAGMLILALFHIARNYTPRRLKYLKDYLYWPATATPSFVSLLGNNRVRDSDILLATLLSLTARKEVAFIDEIFVWRHPDRNDFSAFTPRETLLFQWLFANDPQYGSVLSAERLRVATRQPAFRAFAKNFRKSLKKDFDRSRLVRHRVTKILRVASVIFAVLFALVGTGLLILTRSYGPLILFAVAAAYGVNAATYTFLSRYGAQRRWETRQFAAALATPKKIFMSCRYKMSDVEAAITSLPAAVALNRVSAFFSGIKDLKDDLFYRTAYGILHVYRDLPLPTRIPRRITSSERHFLLKELEKTERMLTYWNAMLKSFPI